jgi:UMF1 family MFS transporter
MDVAEANAQTGGRVTKRGLFGWMMLDWAAQPFFTVVITFVFGPYFAARMASDPVAGQTAWSLTATIAGIVIAILSPVLGSIADATGNRKRWIGFFAVIKIIALCSLWWAAPGSSIVAIGLLVILASIAAEFSIVFNDSQMPRLVSKDNVGTISNIAWGMGYLGGMIALFIVLLLLAGSPTTGKTLIGVDPLFGLDPKAGEDARVTGPFSAFWYLIFILPMFLFTPDTATGMPIGKAVRSGLSELKSTLGELRHRTGIMRFLIARMIYQDGVNGLLILGGAFAVGMFGWETTEIGLYGIILNIVAIFGCGVASVLDRRLGSKLVVAVALVLLFVATLGFVSTGPGFTLFGLVPLSADDSGGLFGTAAEKVYILYGVLVGLSFGPVQASSRSWLARSVTPEEAGRYFGIYALSGRATTFMATGLNTVLIMASGSPRLGMASMLLFFAVGLAILAMTPYPADKAASSRSS